MFFYSRNESNMVSNIDAWVCPVFYSFRCPSAPWTILVDLGVTLESFFGFLRVPFGTLLVPAWAFWLPFGTRSVQFWNLFGILLGFGCRNRHPNDANIRQQLMPKLVPKKIRDIIGSYVLKFNNMQIHCNGHQTGWCCKVFARAGSSSTNLTNGIQIQPQIDETTLMKLVLEKVM